ncbi:MAG: DinB family protein [Candidatus Eisenbacteria bacterium]
MHVVLDEVLAVLSRTPRVLDAQLRGLPAAWTEANEGEGTWTPRNVLGHLIDGEDQDWIPRAQVILGAGADRRFEPFDRFQHLSRDVKLVDLLETFAEKRAANLDLVRSWRLSANDLLRTGEHPDFGSVSLNQLLATWVAHDLNHIAQITRVMALRYVETVGPWKAYLSVLKPRP